MTIEAPESEINEEAGYTPLSEPVKRLVDAIRGGTAADVLLTADTRAGLQTALDILADVERLNAAIDVRETAVKAAQQRVDAAVAAHTSVAADRALSVDDAEVKAATAQLKKLATVEEEAKGQLEHESLVLAELNRRLGIAEEALAAQHVPLLTLRGTFDNHLAELLAAELRLHAEALAGTVAFFATLATAAQSYRTARALQELVIPDPLHELSHFLKGTFVEDGQGRRDVALAIQADPLLMAAQIAGKEFPSQIAKLAGYVPRSTRLAKAVPYVKRGHTVTLGGR